MGYRESLGEYPIPERISKCNLFRKEGNGCKDYKGYTYSWIKLYRRLAKEGIL